MTRTGKWRLDVVMLAIAAIGVMIAAVTLWNDVGKKPASGVSQASNGSGSPNVIGNGNTIRQGDK